MRTMPDATPVQSSQGQSPGRWLVKLPEAVRVDRLIELNADLTRGGRLWLVGRFAATFCIGVAVALAWPYGDAARTLIANASPQLGWLTRQATTGLAAPDPGQQPHYAIPSDLETVRDRVDRIATTQEQMTRTVAQLTAGQAEIAQEIAKVREVEQYLLYKTSYKSDEGAVPARPAAGHVHNKPGRRLSSSTAR
jgi:hypothetical protein